MATPADNSMSSRRRPRTWRHRSRRARPALLVGLGLALVAAACGGGVDGRTRSERLLELADLGRCPDPLVIQTDWYPEPEHGALYHLTGGQGRIDPESGRFRGPLAADPDITLEIRTGGPFLGARTALDQMVADDEIFLAYVSTDEAIARYERSPTLAVVAPLDVNPQALMWDPGTYRIESWADVADTDAAISHVDGAYYTDFLVANDLVDADQLEPTYDGSPDRFVAQDGRLIQQGFATQEPYVYENVLTDWGRPVESLLVHDAGYETYQGPLAILRERLGPEARACLAAFVPLVQQSIVDFQRDPTVANELLIDVVADLGSVWTLTEDGALATVVEMGTRRIVGNGSNAVVGDFDFDRVEQVIRVAAEQMTTIDVPSGLEADDLVTNEFVDPAIGL